MAPRLTTWYRRACMTAEAGRVRITLDEHLTFCRPQQIGTVGCVVGPRPEDVIATGPARVLEIKLGGGMPDWLARALDGLRPAPQFSKFRMGMIAMNQRFGSPDPELDGTRRPLTDAVRAQERAGPMTKPARQGGMFIVFEGIDGSGKTTISNRVAKALRARGGGRRARARGGRVRFQRDPRDSRLLPGRAQPGARARAPSSCSTWPARSSCSRRSSCRRGRGPTS